jgi:hypothetical protein
MNSIVTRTLTAIVLATAVGWAQIGSANADDQFSDAKLTAFVNAVAEVHAISQRWDPLIEGAETEQQKAEMAETARAEMVDAVQVAPDMTVDEYNQIVKAGRVDSELAARIEKMFVER